jgi:Family of unknown function (DUF6455)
MRLLLSRRPLATQVRHRAELLDCVMQALRVDPAAAVRRDGGKAFAEARATCLHCLNSRACQNWLDAAEALPLPADFCPNARFFRELMTSGTTDDAFDEGQRKPLDA